MSTAAQRRIEGIGASPGVALGPAFAHAAPRPAADGRRIAGDEVEAEVARVGPALAAVAGRLSEAATELAGRVCENDAEILEAQAELARDPELAGGAERRVREDRLDAVAALRAAGEAEAAELAAMDDEYLAARADDVRDVAQQAAAEAAGKPAAAPAPIAEPSVVVAVRLTPVDTVRLAPGSALAFVTAEGSRTSHVSIMARSLGIPAVVGIGEEAVAAIPAGATIAVDGDAGTVIVDPDDDARAEHHRRHAEHAAQRRRLERFARVQARTRDGRHVRVEANLGSPAECERARRHGADGVGLLRTEFLFMERDRLPGEEEQYEAYRAVAEAFDGPVTIRTLDVGGDKPLPGIERPREDNPFLGVRGIRLSLERPDELLHPQLRAALRAAAHGEVRLMFPMVSTVAEVRAARAALDRCRAALGAAAGAPAVGIMVETPAAALCAAELAREVDFFSVGTNDLIQYTTAADRGDDRLGALHAADHPAVLRLLDGVCRAAAAAGIPVAVCGEAAADPALIPTLVGLGVDELSMSPSAIPRAKEVITSL